MKLIAYVNGVGLLGPGFANWEEAACILSGSARYSPKPTVLATPSLLPPAERRRVGRVVKLAVAVAAEATARASSDPAQLASVFSSSGGDGHVCHELCTALALEPREVSPTRFSNSVHNAAAGYWSIATGAQRESNVLCAYDASFAAGLLEAMSQVVVDGEAVLLASYDTEYPEPLRRVRPIPDAFGVALVLAPIRTAQSSARIEATIVDNRPDSMRDDALEMLRSSIPAARCLPLMRQLALRAPGDALVEYLDHSCLAVAVAPCT